MAVFWKFVISIWYSFCYVCSQNNTLNKRLWQREKKDLFGWSRKVS